MSRTALSRKGHRSAEDLVLPVISSWKKPLDPLLLLQDYCEANQSPTTLGLWLCAKYREIGEIIDFKVDASHYLDGKLSAFPDGRMRFRHDYQAARLLSKYPFKGIRDTRQAAIDAWWVFERRCADSNRTISLWDLKPIGGGFDEIFHLATRLIAEVLDEFDPMEWVSSCRFGPGVTADSKDRLVHDKLIGPLGVSPESRPFLDLILESSPAWLRAREGRKSSVVIHGCQAFVPKNAKTDRSIETQPSGSVYLQAGIGTMIRRRLKKVGVDLNDQGRNQFLSLQGSLTGRYATLDLEGASDSMSYQLVKHMLPVSWFHALTICRLNYLKLADGTLHPLEKFSSMGNGYTFELESLIFWALAEATTRVLNGTRLSVSVFGDDIVCEVAVAPRLIEVLEMAGFRVNNSKTFISGLFRESCGRDYFDGLEVRPVYIREEVCDVESYLRLSNRFWRYASSRGSNIYLCASYHKCWIRVVRGLPPTIREFLTGPAGEGDGWLIQGEDEVLTRRGAFRERIPGTGRARWLVRSIQTVPLRRRVKENHFDSVIATMLFYQDRKSLFESRHLYSRVPADISGGHFSLLSRDVRSRLKLERLPLEWASYPSVWM